MGGDEHVPTLMKKSAPPRSALPCRLGERFAAILNILQDALQTLARQFRSRGYFLNVGKGIGIIGFRSKFLEERMDLGENKEHFAATARLQKKFFVERAVHHERRSHIQIAADLAKPGVFLAGKRIHNFDELVCALRPEFCRQPVSSLSHLLFAAEVVESQNQLRIA